MKIAFHWFAPFLEKQLPSPNTNLVCGICKCKELYNENCRELGLYYFLKSNFLHLLLNLSLFRSLTKVLYNIRLLYTISLQLRNIHLNRPKINTSI